MSFTRPAIHVYQELISTTASTTTPFFELCIVGPSYQVVEKQAFPVYSADASYSTAYVGQTAGTVVDLESVSLSLTSAYAKIWPATTESNLVDVTTVGALTTLSVQDSDPASFSFINSSVLVGDAVKVVYTDSATNTSTVYTSLVQTISATGLSLTLRKNLPLPIVTETAVLTITRPIGSTVSVPSTALTITESLITIADPSLLTATISGNVYPIFSGNVVANYRALRAYLAGDFTDITSMTDARSILGDVHQDNPLSTACSIVFSNATVPFKVLPVATDDAVGYLAALDLLTTNESVYVLVPLTQDEATVSAFAAHCTAMSTPAKSKWRICYANTAMPSNKIIVDRNAGTIDPGMPASVGVTATNYVKDMATGAFATSVVVAGDFIDIYAPTVGSALGAYLYSFKVKSVLNDTVCEVYSDSYTDNGTAYEISVVPTNVVAVESAVNYQVNRVLTTQGIADEMVSIAKSYSNKRLRLVQPDTIMLNINSTDYVLPGYYLCVAYGAMRSGNPPHQGLTTMGIGGVSRIFRSNKYFKDSQLDEMAGGGVFWVVQDNASSLPYCIYQTTTDTTQLETIEDSIVSTIDYASKFYKDNLKAVLGKFNVNTISIKYVTAVIKDVTDQMLRMTYPYIGPILVSGTLKSVTTSADTIIPTVTISVPFPVNDVDLYLEV